MIYVMSDLHGCYEKYVKMLGKIRFNSEDVLYILGDVLDRGPEGMRILLDASKRKNVVLLLGNHDYQAGTLLAHLHLLDDPNCPKELVELYGIWLTDGGKSTLAEYLQLQQDEQKKVLQVIKRMKTSVRLTVNGEKYLLAHTVPAIEKLPEFDKWSREDFILGEPTYTKSYFDDICIITGHTPTGFIKKESVGKIWKGNGHIAIDCGCVFGKTLGCLCLDTMEEFYV